MASKELIEKVARDLALLNDDTEETWENYHADAQKASSTMLAALQEPTGEMKKVWDDDMSDWIDERIEDPYHPWKIMLNASPLGEQSE